MEIEVERLRNIKGTSNDRVLETRTIRSLPLLVPETTNQCEQALNVRLFQNKLLLLEESE